MTTTTRDKITDVLYVVKLALLVAAALYVVHALTAGLPTVTDHPTPTPHSVTRLDRLLDEGTCWTNGSGKPYPNVVVLKDTVGVYFSHDQKVVDYTLANLDDPGLVAFCKID